MIYCDSDTHVLKQYLLCKQVIMNRSFKQDGKLVVCLLVTDHLLIEMRLKLNLKCLNLYGKVSNRRFAEQMQIYK